MKKSLIGLLIFAIMLATMSGCAKSNGSDSSDTITIGTSPYPAWYVWYIAQDEGLFKKAGLNVTLKYFPVYSDSLQAFDTGKLDMLNIATCDTVAPYNQGIDFKIVMINDNSNGADGLVAKNDIKSMQDLKGKNVVTEYGTIEHFFLLKALESAGMSENDIKYTNMTVNDSGTAMLADKVDAACVWEPSLSMALGNTNNHLLYSSEQTPGLIPDLLVATSKLIKDNPKNVQKLVDVWYQALDFYKQNPDKAAADMAKQANVSVSDMKGIMAGSKLFSVSDNISAMTQKQNSYSYLPYTITETAKFLKSVKMVDKVPSNPLDMIDTTFIKAEEKTYGSDSAPDTKALKK
ncbi:MAG: ABC transporter substrate-binding protein [Ethanoligenens sp.]